MKNIYKLFIIMLSVAFCTNAFAQQRIVKFTGRDRTNHYHVQLDRVEIFNLDQLWEEIIYWPDTSLIMGTVGIEDYENQAHVQLMNNVPNPFNGRTEFALILPEGRDLRLEIFDMNGKCVVAEDFPSLPVGMHLFEANLVSPQTYLLSATVKDGRMTLKMINEGHSGANTIRYLGMTDYNGDFTVYLKDDRASGNYPFAVGDEMQYTGFATIDGVELESNTVNKKQYDNETIPLWFDVTAPTVITNNIMGITDYSATLNNKVTETGGANVVARGTCWGTSHNPTTSDNYTVDGDGLGQFTSNLEGLSMNTTYYARAYATNAVGTAYGTEVSFTTPTTPSVTTNNVTYMAPRTATCGGTVTSDGGSWVTARGVCWSSFPNPTINGSHTSNSNGIGSFTATISGLDLGTTYYVRAYATNSLGTAYGEQKIFSTVDTPSVITSIVSNYTQNTATCGGVVTYDGGTTVTERGVCWGTTPGPTISENHTVNGSGTGSFTSNLTSLTPGTTYYVRAYATNIAGTVYGTEYSFTTWTTPTVTTSSVSSITSTTAICGGNVTSNGGTNLTAKGVCWSTSQNPTVGDSHTTNGIANGSFSSSITGLTPNTTYYVRAYATNSVGTAYGEQRTFTTNCNTVTVSISGTSTINYGQSTTLTASGASTYSWSTGANTVSITVNPTNTTTYTVTGTNSYGCTATASKTVTVNPIAPTVTTNNVSGITAISASCGGNVTSNGGANVTARGVCWSTSPNPTTNDNKTTNGTGTGSFTSSLPSLMPNTTYYVRAYATNSAGTAYGEQITFTTNCNTVSVYISGVTTINYGQSTTLTASGAIDYIWSTGATMSSITVTPMNTTTYTVTGTNIYGCAATATMTVTVNNVVPTVTTINVTGIGSTYATCGGNVTSTGGANVTARGVCWSTSPSPTTSNSKTTNGTGTGSFTSSLSSLTPNTTYYVRAYATNSVGTNYGEQKTFTTNCNTVSVSISGTTTINYGQSTTLTASGASTYSWSTGANTASITVSPSSTTSYTVTGTNSYGCTATATKTVTVNPIAPTVTTSTVSSVTSTSASCGGNVTSDGGANVVARGVCWSTLQNPTVSGSHTTNGSGTGTFTSSITGLTPNTTYYVRAYATNSAGTNYGEQKTFTTGCGDGFANGILVNATATSICEGEHVILSVAPVIQGDWTDNLTYLWDANANNSTEVSVDVQPSTTTSYSVTATSGNCSVSGQITINVYSILAVPVVNVDYETICNGSQVTLNVTNPVEGAIYTWKKNGNVIASANGPILIEYPTTVDGASTQYVYTVIATLPQSGCVSSVSDNAIVTVDPSPTVTITVDGNTTICQGGNTMLHANITPVGTYAYQWYKDNVIIEGANSADIIFVENARETDYNFSVVVSASNFGCVVTAVAPAITVVEDPVVTATISNNYACFGEVVTFTAIVEGAAGDNGMHDYSYQWYTNDGDGLMQVVANGAIYTTEGNEAPGNHVYIVIVTSNDGCNAQSNVVNYGVVPIPSVAIQGDSSIVHGQSVTLTASGASTYSWSTGATTASITVNPTSTTAYTVTGTNSYGCTATASKTVTVSVIIDDKSCPAAPTVTDHEGNVYATVQIGNQCWMRDNLRTTTSPSTGTYLIISATGLGNTFTGKQAFWCHNDSATYAPMNYGLLYNWNAAVDTFNTSYGENSVNGDYNNAISVSFTGNRRGICPVGWHLPSDAEWTTMTNYVKSQSQYVCGSDNTYIAKALASTEGWNTYTSSCAVGNDQAVNNATGFSAIPAQKWANTWFGSAGSGAFFWSSSQSSSYLVYIRYLYYNDASVLKFSNDKRDGHSVRCLRDAATAVVDEKSCPSSPTVTDIDGNIYSTVQIGGQCWMRENLRTARYADGTDIYQGGGFCAPGTAYSYCCYPSNNADNKQLYGLLYSWDAVMHDDVSSDGTPSGVQGVCPSGWHVPSDAEWMQLTDYISSQSQYWCGNDSTNIAKALADTTGWSTYGSSLCCVNNNQSDNNATGFRALPAGELDYNGYFSGIAKFWSATESTNNYAKNIDISYSRSIVQRNASHKRDAYSVRCLLDENSTSLLPVITTNDVTSITSNTAVGGGHILSNGGSPLISSGICWSTAHNPRVTDRHTIDGTETGVFTSNLTELASNITYYVRAYATNQYGTVYGDEVSFTAPINPYGDQYSCQGLPVLTDVDGNVYNTVQIGGQCWMRENLRATHYADGNDIAQGNNVLSTDNFAFASTSAYWYYPGGDSTYKHHYGLLYNWKALMYNESSSDAIPSGVQGICPTGWHIPSDAEWTMLTDYLSSQSQYICGENNNNIAKALSSTTGWTTSNNLCYVGNNQADNNTTHFGALPAGCSHGHFYSYDFGYYTIFCSSTESNSGTAWTRRLYTNVVDRSSYSKVNWYSVRCLRDEDYFQSFPSVTTNNVTDITDTTANCGGVVAFNGNVEVSARGVCWSTVHNPTISGSHTIDGSGSGNFNSNITGLASSVTFYVRAYATTVYGTVYGNEVSFTIPINPNGDARSCPTLPTLTDIDGNVYNTVQIGTQCWMRENLKTTHYDDGSVIALGSSSSVITTSSYTTPCRYYPNNDSANIANYGYLYNGVVLYDTISSNGTKHLCPTGWHLPSGTEWAVMTNYVRGTYNSSVAKALSAQTGWTLNEMDGTPGNNQTDNNATGFSARPAGSYGNGSFGSCALYWRYNPSEQGRYHSIANNSTGIGWGMCASFYAYSIRCVHDESTSSDNKPCFGTPTVTDIDGNVYNTVQIGDQCWMRENLRTTKYADGTSISVGGDTNYSIVDPYYYNYASSTIPLLRRGYLYNWSAAMHGTASSSTNPSCVQGICPTGWHLPSDAEWTKLTNYVSSRSEYICGSDSTRIAKALASTTDWHNNYNASYVVGYDQGRNNATGYSAVPVGRYNGSSFVNESQYSIFWSSTHYSADDAYYRSLNYNSSYVERNYTSISMGFSVRCLRDAPSVVIDDKSCPSSPTVTDHEGNVYATVQIGNQCWMRENLRTTTSPSTGTYLIPVAGTGYTYTGKQARWYNNDSTTYAPMNYGLLYNWNAAVDTFNTAYGETSVNSSSDNAVSVSFTGNRRGICPSGWHLPSDAEWTTMTNYVSGQSEYVCGSDNTYIAKALASTEGWNSNSGTCVVGNDQSSNNATGFSAVPAGYCAGSSFGSAGDYAGFWSSTQYSSYTAYYRYLSYGNAVVGRTSYIKYNGRSVRCLRD